MKKTLTLSLVTLFVLKINVMFAQGPQGRIIPQVRGMYKNDVFVVDDDGESDGWGQAIRFGGEWSGERIGSNRKGSKYGAGNGPKNGLLFWTGGTMRMTIDVNGLTHIIKLKADNANVDSLSVKDFSINPAERCWADYVFEKNYSLMDLKKLETFISNNKHLPNFPSAKTIDEEGKYNVDNIIQGLVKTVEEQTLYIIELNKQLQKQSVKLESLESLIKK